MKVAAIARATIEGAKAVRLFDSRPSPPELRRLLRQVKDCGGILNPVASLCAGALGLGSQAEFDFDRDSPISLPWILGCVRPLVPFHKDIVAFGWIVLEQMSADLRLETDPVQVSPVMLSSCADPLTSHGIVTQHFGQAVIAAADAGLVRRVDDIAKHWATVILSGDESRALAALPTSSLNNAIVVVTRHLAQLAIAHPRPAPFDPEAHRNCQQLSAVEPVPMELGLVYAAAHMGRVLSPLQIDAPSRP